MQRPHPATLVAVIALVIAGTSTGYAAGTLVTSDQIKDKTIKVKDISPNARDRLRGQTGPAGPAGPQGVAGGVGANGAQGLRGFSSWDTIPSGRLVSGAWDVWGANAVSQRSLVHLPGRTPVALDDTHIVKAPNAHCRNDTFLDADPGYLCLWQDVTSYTGGASFPAVDGQPYLDNAFVVLLTNTAGNSQFGAYGPWAYRAP